MGFFSRKKTIENKFTRNPDILEQIAQKICLGIQEYFNNYCRKYPYENWMFLKFRIDRMGVFCSEPNFNVSILFERIGMADIKDSDRWDFLCAIRPYVGKKLGEFISKTEWYVDDCGGVRKDEGYGEYPEEKYPEFFVYYLKVYLKKRQDEPPRVQRRQW